MLGSRGKPSRGQIALEFLVVYAFISIVFAIIFTLIAAQRAATLAQQEYGLLQLQAQNIASYMDQAVQAGNGYSVTIPLTGSVNANPYNISVSTTGVVTLQSKIIKQVISSYAFSYAKSLVINGTLLSSGNGVSVYLIPSYTGSVTLTNSKGTIYVDQPAPSVLSLAQNINVNPKGNVRAAMTTQGAYMYTPITSALEPSKFTVSVWFLENSYGNGYPYVGTVYASGGYNQGYELLLPQTSDTSGGIVVGNGAEAYISDPSAPPLGVWNNYVATFDGTNVKLYLNGKLVNSGIQSGVTYTGGITQFIVGSDYNFISNPAVYYSNVQLYNTALTSNQVNSIYQGGIALSPVMPANVIGWWPLNGNANDYSGNGYGATGPASYNGVIEDNVHLTNGAGSALASNPIGFVTSRGIASGATGGGLATYTDSNGNATVFITSNGFVSGTSNLTITAFNGNGTIAGNLIGWWPLNEGFGSVAYDLSTHGNAGYFANAIWGTINQNVTNFAAATMPGNPGGGNTNSPVYNGWIAINQTSSLLNIARNGSFTATAWIYYKGTASFRCPGIIGDQPAYDSGQGFQLMAYNRCGLLFVNSSAIAWPSSSTSFPMNTLEFVAAEYNGSTGQAAVYLNNTLFASAILPKGLGLSQATTPYTIGDMSFDNSGINGFNGSISNVQLYSTYLTPSQIKTLYSNGANSAPMGDAGLTGWWPLNGASNGLVPDSSSNNNTGTIKYNVTFRNSQYVKRANTSLAAPNFNVPANDFVATTTGNILLGANAMSVSVWFSSPSYNGFNLAAQPGGHGFVDEEGVFGLKFGPSPETVSLCLGSVVWCANTVSYTFTPNLWYNVAATWSSGNVVSYYVNGALVGTAGPYSGTITTTPGSPFEIGTANSASPLTHLFNGTIANVQVYNIALTAAQARQIYQQGILLQNRQNVTLG